ncbi:MAG: carboxypeptidase-like regulatory domain-containing protein [Luteimonas sp.]
MMKNTTAAALLAALATLSACEADRVDASRPASGYATGTVVDTRGNPIAGAKILLDNTVFYASYINGSTAEDGTYRLKVQPGAWRAYASIRKDYNGRTYSLELHPDSIDSFDETGAVRNFVWKLEGRKQDNDWGYYGGLVKVFNETGFYEMENVEITLVPDGPLIDGSTGRTLVLRSGDNYWRQLAYLEDIPIGRYAVTAALMDGDTRQPLKLRGWDAKDDPAAELRLDFTPDTSGSPGATASIAIGY